MENPFYYPVGILFFKQTRQVMVTWSSNTKHAFTIVVYILLFDDLSRGDLGLECKCSFKSIDLKATLEVGVPRDYSEFFTQ